MVKTQKGISKLITYSQAKINKTGSFKEKFNTQNVFLVISLIFGLLFVFTTPLMWGVDENAHFARAYQISQGIFESEYIGNEKGQGYGGYIPTNVKSLINYANEDIVNKPVREDGVEQVNDPEVYKELSSAALSNESELYSFSGSAAYSPVVYAPNSIAIKISKKLDFSINSTIRLARLAGLLSYVVISYFAIRVLRDKRAKWTIFAIALIPMTLFQASVISADTLTNSTVLLFAALFIKSAVYKKKLNRFEIILLLFATIALPLLKPVCLLMLPLLFAIPKENIKFSDKITGLPIKISILIISAILGLYWMYVTKDISSTVSLYREEWARIIPAEQLKYVLHSPFSFLSNIFRTMVLNDNAYLQSMVGYIGFNLVSPPGMAIVSSVTSLVISILIIENITVDRKLKYFIFIMCLILVFSIFGTLYLTATPVGYYLIQGIQGRYFIFLLPLFLVLFYPSSVRNKSILKYKTGSMFIVLLCLIALTSTFIKYRYVTWG